MRAFLSFCLLTLECRCFLNIAVCVFHVILFSYSRIHLSVVDLAMQRQLLLLERCWLCNLEKKGFRNRTKIWAIINSLRNNGVKLLLDDNDEGTSRSSFVIETFVFLQRKKWIEEHVFRILNLICRKNVNRGGWLI